MAGFDAPETAPRFLEICDQHTHVLHVRPVAPSRGRYVLENVALAPVVAESVAMLETMLVANRLTCEVSIAASAFAIAACADREKTREILINLLTNAIRFTPAGGRMIVEVSAGAIEPDTVRIRVTDTGIGITPSQLDHLFEQVGLGLTISRDHARAMGGDLTVSSAVGVGTTFSLTLPAAQSEP
jgi:signal transduction histidine kinase